ncbi:MAG: hypothetical protein KVP17_001326 [Porospora cf. gigantea B]|uniref:uncharacterized protein n=1 Tax=Porospora cf. gigantea B TaxID=2853592 RepID=UPI003571B6C1|nr:MAG: hypothetical protein KVP17_001326 [Porospora cf. gigantea B]
MCGNLEFLRLCRDLKRLPRKGWVLSGVEKPESVAEHMFRAAMCAFLISDPSVDRDRCIKMCLVHDLAEALVGDITPKCGVSREEKAALEQEAMERIAGMLEPVIGDELMDLFQEFEAGDTLEAKFCHDIDKFEMIEQAKGYEDEQSINLDEFFDTPKPTTQMFQHLQKVILDSRLKS